MYEIIFLFHNNVFATFAFCARSILSNLLCPVNAGMLYCRDPIEIHGTNEDLCELKRLARGHEIVYFDKLLVQYRDMGTSYRLKLVHTGVERRRFTGASCQCLVTWLV